MLEIVMIFLSAVNLTFAGTNTTLVTNNDLIEDTDVFCDSDSCGKVFVINNEAKILNKLLLSVDKIFDGTVLYLNSDQKANYLENEINKLVLAEEDFPKEALDDFKTFVKLSKHVANTDVKDLSEEQKKKTLEDLQEKYDVLMVILEGILSKM